MSERSDDSRPDPARRGRLGFPRWALSAVGLAVIVGFLIWVFLP